MGLRFSFPVGESERHTVHLSFAQFWGYLTITVDGKPVIREWRVLPPGRLTREYRFTVGDGERHDVVVVKEQKRLYGGVPTAYVQGVYRCSAAGVYSS